MLTLDLLGMRWIHVAGRKRLSGILGVSTEQASQFQDSFLQTYKEVQTFIQRTIQQCHKQGMCALNFLLCLSVDLYLKVTTF